MKYEKRSSNLFKATKPKVAKSGSNPGGGDLHPASISLTTRKISVPPQHPVHASVIVLT